jgi:hypothetical protein
MRRKYFILPAALALALIAALGPGLWSGGREKAAEGLAAPQNAVSKIAKVTVYPNSALVTREVVVPDGNGLVELVITPMPNQIVPSTMYSEGGLGIRVLTTRFRTRQVLEDTSAERRKLDSEMEKLMVDGVKIISDIGSIQKNMELLAKLEGVTQKDGRTGDEVIALAKYVMEQRGEKAKELVACNEQKRQNDIKIEFCKRKMGELGSGSGREERDAVIVIDREAGKGGIVRLNYLVSAVTWRPEYKLRAGKAGEDVEVDYQANLKQNSGEDWSHVKMTLSTAQPMLNAAPPELCMLEPILTARGPSGGKGPMAGGGIFAPGVPNMDLERKAKELRGQAGFNYRSGGTKEQEEAARWLNTASAYEQQIDLMRTKAEIVALQKKLSPAADPSRNDGPSVTYHLPNRLTVPSRNDEQVIEVVKLNLAPKYYYKAVPVLNRHVYRLADLVNKSEHVLLPGEATMYQGTDFVGRMPMPLVAVGEEFTAGFGVDTQLQIQRQLMDKTKTTQGGNQVLKYEYRILVSSFKSQPVKLQVWDRLPKGETESINVSLTKTSPELSKDAIYLRESHPNNLLRWDLEIEPNRNGEKALPIAYEFRMELDRQMAITGFQSGDSFFHALPKKK